MQRQRLPGLVRIPIFYLLSITFASLAFAMRDSIDQSYALLSIHNIIRHLIYNVLHVIPLPPLSGGYYSLPSFLVALLSVWIMVRFVEHRPLISVGFPLNWSAVYLSIFGLAVSGIAVRSAQSLIVYFHNGIYLAPWQTWPYGFHYLLYALTAESLLPPIYEELVFRGYLLPTLMENIGIAPAVVLISLLFGLGHYYQGGWIPVLDTGLLGVAMSLAYLKTRGLWLSIGMHLGWDIIGNVPYSNPLSHGLMLPNFYTLPGDLIIVSLLVVIFWILPLHPTPQSKALWDRYIHPAPWPPWKRRAQLEAEQTRE